MLRSSTRVYNTHEALKSSILTKSSLFLPGIAVRLVSSFTMSAYALSGSLFPPVGPLHSSETSRSSKAGLLQENQFHEDPSSSSTSDGVIARQNNDASGVEIAVKAATIDPMRLIQPPTGRGKLLPKGRMAETNRPPRSIQGSSLAGSSMEPSDHPLCSEDDEIESEEQQDVTAPSTSRTTSCDVSTPHRDAIQFELSISLNGRIYSATRTLPRIIELRNELIRELDIRRKGLRLRRMRWRKNKPEDHTMDKDDDTVETVDEYTELDQELDVTIPELPECIADGTTDSVATGGFGSRGFRMVQALLHSYCPAVERWLRKVADVVPPNSSPCLTNFLWEPLSKNWSSSQSTKGPIQSNIISSKIHGSLSTLDSIDEAHDLSAEEDNDERDRNNAESVCSR